MRLTKEQIAVQKEFITKGTRIVCDCVVTTPYVSRTKTSLDEAIASATKARGMVVQLAAALRGSRH